MQNDAFTIQVIEKIAAQAFPRSAPLFVERVEEGMSTIVYRIYRNDEIFYLRILPEEHASFAPEVLVHQMLRTRQVKVPEIVFFEHYNSVLDRSVMVTSEIKGIPLTHCPTDQDYREILHQAGRDLAVINSIQVKHFGWIQRDKQEISQLEAEFSGYRAFVYEHLERDLLALEQYVLASNEITAILSILRRFNNWLDEEQAWLAHGDFDTSHIYQDQGHYSGIIDFGEIRGGNALYDLGHFRMHEGETLAKTVLPWLVAGYAEMATLPADYEKRIYFTSLLIAIRTLARVLEKRPLDVRNHHSRQALARELLMLLD